MPACFLFTSQMHDISTVKHPAQSVIEIMQPLSWSYFQVASVDRKQPCGQAIDLLKNSGIHVPYSTEITIAKSSAAPIQPDTYKQTRVLPIIINV